MAPLSVTFSDLEGHFCFLQPFCHTTQEIQRILSTVCFINMNRKVHVACNFSCYFENKGLVNVRCDFARATLCLHGICCHRESVCLSVTYRSCTKTATRRITQITLYDSPGSLFLLSIVIASTTVRWRKNMQCHQHLTMMLSKSDDYSYGPVDITVTSLLRSFF